MIKIYKIFTLFLIPCFLSSSFNYSQEKSDIQEMNLYGSVKSIKMIKHYADFEQFNEIARKQDTTKEIYYVGMEMGPALLHFSSNQINSEKYTQYGLSFFGGFVPFRALRLGLNLNGYLIEPFDFNSPEKGISISNIHAQIQILPFTSNNIFANIQGGWSTYINHHPNGFDSKGISGKIGVGYHYVLGKNIFASVIFNYGFGKFNNVNSPGVLITNQHYNAYEIAIGITYRKFKIKNI